MKKIAFAATTLALALAAGNASAANAGLAGPSAGNFGLSVDLTRDMSPTGATPELFMVKGRYFIAKNMAVLAGAGLGMVDTGAPNNSKYTDIGIMGGFRYYLKTDELAPFVGGHLQYTSGRDAGNTADVTGLDLMFEGGAEYYFSKQFSLEGALNLGYVSRDNKPLAAGASSFKTTIIGSTTASLRANFYF